MWKVIWKSNKIIVFLLELLSVSEHDVTDMSIINDFSELKTTFEPFKRSQDAIDVIQ